MDIKAMFPEGEAPLDTIPADGGFASVFRTFACVGDSLSSGEFETVDEEGKKGYHDLFEYSWGQYLARMCGSKTYNFSRGGMTAREYMESFADAHGYFSTDIPAQAYIVALGVNDVSRCLDGMLSFGELSDVDFEDYKNNKKTFVGYYTAILQKYRTVAPDSFLFLMTMPRCIYEDPARREYNDRHRQILLSLAEKLERCYVLDLRRYAPMYDEDFTEKFYLHGHLNPMGYILTAKMTAAYIDYIVRHDMPAFAEAGFIGTHILDFRKK